MIVVYGWALVAVLRYGEAPNDLSYHALDYFRTDKACISAKNGMRESQFYEQLKCVKSSSVWKVKFS